MFKLSFVATLLAAAAYAHITEVDTEYGRIRGDYEAEYKLTGYYGIPFAAPPVKDLRLRPPTIPSSWNGTKDCTVDKFFHVCPQFHIFKKEYYGSEDCLYMNIYVPEEAETEPLPVMFWIYGGGYSLGDGYEFGFYRGKHLAATRRVIVIEHNYRLGALGFMAHPALKNETEELTTGNYGVQDQQFALSFVKRNIANFNGDPNRIAIFGESAGAFSVCWHLVSPKSRGLFSAAIMESGTCLTPEFFIEESRAYEFGGQVIKHLQCDPNSPDVLDCIRSKDTYDFFMDKEAWPRNETIPPLAPIMPYGPVIDGSSYGLVRRPLDSLEMGDFARVPTIMGTNKDEGTIFVLSAPSVIPGLSLPLSNKTLPVALAHFFNDSCVNDVIAAYPIERFKDADDCVAKILRDFFFACPTRRAMRALAAHNVSGYTYQFTMDLPNWVDWDALGNYHSSELAFVFDNQWPPIVHTFDDKEKRLAASFTLYWTNMARFGDPNYNLGADQQKWPKYNPTSELFMRMETPTAVDAHLLHAECDFWDTHYPKYYTP